MSPAFLGDRLRCRGYFYIDFCLIFSLLGCRLRILFRETRLQSVDGLAERHRLRARRRRARRRCR